MRLISFTDKVGASWGAIIRENEGVDLGRRMGGCPTLRIALERGFMAQAQLIVDAVIEADFKVDQVHLDAVIPDPDQILCIGLNYEEHRIETRRERSGNPTVFARFGRSQVGHKGAILRPPESVMLDFEGELAIIIGQTVRRCSEADAMNFVAGYACYNDASVRDYQRHTSQFHPGKNFPSTGAFGPSMITADEIPDYRVLTIETRLNGAVVQSAGLDQLIFSIPELIAYCSTFTELRAGDVIVTGTPGGVGTGRTPPLWMKHGDVVEVEVSQIGTLRNPVKDEFEILLSQREIAAPTA